MRAAFVIQALVLVGVSAAHADDTPANPVEEKGAFIGAGLYFAKDTLGKSGVVLEGAARLPNRRMWVRVAGEFGGTSRGFNVSGSGEFRRGSAGVEAQGCTDRQRFCVFGASRSATRRSTTSRRKWGS